MLRTLSSAFALLCASMSASAQVAPSPDTDVYVVMFRADWCPPCKVVEPRLETALASLADAGIEYVEIDISSPGASEVGAHRAFDREIVPQYNRWLGLTGFAAVVDATNKRTLGCVNMMYDAPSMAMHIRNLKTFAVADEATLDLTCPEANNPVG